MSRTYRRKNVPYYWTLNEALYSLYDSEEEYNKNVREFHSDSLQTMQQVPKWYKVYFLRKPYRAKVRNALIKEAKTGYEGSIPMPIDKGCANYYW